MQTDITKRVTDKTVSSSWVRAVTTCCQQLGVDSEALLRNAGIDPEVVDDIEARIAVTDSVKLWNLISQEPIDSIGLRIGNQLSPAHFPLLAINLIHSESLLGALRIMARYTMVISEGATFDVDIKGDHVSINYQPLVVGFGHHQVDAVLAFILRIADWLVGRHVQPVSVDLTYAEPEDCSTHQEVFGCPLVFNQKAGAVVYPIDELLAPLPAKDPNLAELHERLIKEKLAKIQMPQIILDVREYLNASHELDVERESVAKKMFISGRTLQRKLQEAGTSYQQLLDEERERRALQLLVHTDKPLQEISDVLGFSESSTFSRAFKRWQGVSPQQYRREQGR